MNILIDLVPSTLTVDGIEYPIQSDFRTWILFEQLLLDTDDEFPEDEIFQTAKELIFKKAPPNEFDEETSEKIQEFYTCGKTQVVNESSKEKQSDLIYDYDFDDAYIYAAFLQQYSIDLQTVDYLHWWQFKAMFKALKDDCMIVKIMGYRAIDIDDKMPKEQKIFYHKMKKLYALPRPANEVEKEKELEDLLLQGKPFDHIL